MGTDKKPCKQFQDTHIDGQFDNEITKCAWIDASRRCSLSENTRV
jgi:hypothetical protein